MDKEIRRILSDISVKFDELGQNLSSALSAQGSAPAHLSRNREDLVSIAEQLVQEFSARPAFFHGNVDDPAWLILLTLFVKGERGLSVTVSEACRTAPSAPTVILRHIRMLIDRGTLVRKRDMHDRRKCFIELSPHARGQMAAYLETIVERNRQAHKKHVKDNVISIARAAQN